MNKERKIDFYHIAEMIRNKEITAIKLPDGNVISVEDIKEIRLPDGKVEVI